MSKEELEKLQKKRQELYSWSWFYKNSIKNLMTSRYPGIIKQVEDKKTIGDIKPLLVSPFIDDMWNSHYNNYYDEAGNKRTCSSIIYSKRYQDERQVIDKLSKEIDDVQLKLNKYFKKK